MPGDRVVWAVSACGGMVVVAEPLTIALPRRLAVIDKPGGRSSHSVPTPRGGGAPIALGLLVAAALAFVNAFNFMNGVNGISGAHALAGGMAYGCLGEWRQEPARPAQAPPVLDTARA